MNSFKIISDSSCDLQENFITQYDISIIPYRVTVDGENYRKENVEISTEEFYNILRTQDVFPKTSLPPIQDYYDEFKAALAKGNDIICFNLTSKFSGSYQSAINAKNMILEEYPNANILVMDTMLVTAPQGILILEAARMRENGFSMEEVYEKCKELILTCKVYLTVDSLKYLQKGGRIGKVSAFAGSLLNIKPLIVFTDGELIPMSKIRGRKKTVTEIIKLFKNDIGNNIDDYILFLMHSDEYAEAEELKKTIEHSHGNKLHFEHIVNLGVTIGAHIGPTAIGLGYIKKYESL